MSKLVENYLLQEPIGKGVYGQVFRAIHQKTKLEFAVKVIPKSSFKSNPKLEQLAINQINILSSLKNQNIVRFVQTLKTPNNFYFVYQYCNGGTLENLIQKKKTLSESEALLIFRQLLDAFKELNKNNIMHRDLKPDNIFLSNGKIKLGDFGFCKMLEVNMAQTMLGSPIYMAPQILREEIYTLKADIWSLGVVLFEMLFGFCPFESSSISQLINVIKETELKIPQEINPISMEAQTLIRKMLIKDQFKRIEWVDLFDFKIDDEGKIISGYKKDLGIEALEKYFLFDLIKSNSDEDKRTEHLVQIESERIISAGNQIPQENEFSLKKTYSEQPIACFPNSDYSLQTNLSFKSDATFEMKHFKWVRGIEVLEALAENLEEGDECVMHYLAAFIIQQISQQYQDHPEWTDVLLEEKKCLSDLLKALKKEENIDIYAGKNDILKFWKRASEWKKKKWERAVRFIYNFEENLQIEVESILLS